MPHSLRIPLALGLALAAAGPASAQTPKPAAPQPSGTAVAVIPVTHAKGPGGDRPLMAAEDVFGGDAITTGEAGQAQILFRDRTRLVVGPDSSVTIDKFVFDAAGGAGGAAIKFTRGAFRFITGGGRSDAYALETPTASIGIRGTEFDVAVGSEGTAVIVFRGAVEVCTRGAGRCATIRRSCSAAIARADGSLEVRDGRDPRAGLINTSFPLVKDQSRLRKDFRVWTGRCGLGGGDRATGGGSTGGSRNRGGRGGQGGGDND